VPLSAAAILAAIKLNGEAVAMNSEAFVWGRRVAAEPQRVMKLVEPTLVPTKARHLSETLDEIIERRVEFLTAYQNAAYARRYRAIVERVRATEKALMPGAIALTEAVARYLFKLMAYKDEYEVARLYTDGSFAKQLNATFEGENLRMEVHLAPPILGRKDKTTGLPRKTTFGPWMLKAFGYLAKFRFLRGTPFDIFGHSAERRTERQLIHDYEGLLEVIIKNLKSHNHALAVALASIPEKIRGYGHVKMRHLAAAKKEEAELLARFRAGEVTLPVAAE
jgi:indolepyruvate ferredoxin oxidoreductase